MTSNVHIRTYNGTQSGENYVFALAKGNNAGKPSREPFANSFAIKCDSAEHAHIVYSVLFTLHCARAYESHLQGSCVEFITIKNFQKIFLRALEVVTGEEVIKAVRKIGLLKTDIQHHHQRGQKMEKLLREYAKSIFTSILNAS